MAQQSSRAPVLVLGGTGHYGRHIVASLLNHGAAVRVLSRDAAGAQKTLGPAPQIIEGDIMSRTSILQALNGVSAAVISVSAFRPKQIRQMARIERDAVLAFLAEAEAAGVIRAVYLSVYEVRPEVPGRRDLDSAVIKAAVEGALARSQLNWTVLGAAPSMQIFFAMIRGNTMLVPGGGPPALPTVSALDVGEIAAQAALRLDLGGKRLRMAGPEVLSFPEAARRIGLATGQTIRFRKIPLALPRLAWALTRPLASLSDTLLYVNQMLGFVRLLNRFPRDVAAGAAEAHRQLRDTFDYVPTTIEMEARRWSGPH